MTSPDRKHAPSLPHIDEAAAVGMRPLGFWHADFW